MWIFNVFAACILYSNATEGIIYIRSAIFVLRKDEHVKALLSEDSILKRRRQNIIGMKITAISWMLEFLSGFISLLRFWHYQTIKEHQLMDKMFHLFGNALTTIFIPGSYLLNDEAKKLFILARGWTSFFQNHLIKCFQGKETFNEDNQVA